MAFVNALIIGLNMAGFVFLLAAMFTDLRSSVSTVFVFAGAAMLTLAIILCMEFEKRSEITFDKKVGMEVYFLAPVDGDDTYVVRSADDTQFAYVADDGIVQKDVDNDYVGHHLRGYYRPQVEVTTYERTTEHYRWFFKESEDTELFEVYGLLLPEDAVRYDCAFEDGQYFKYFTRAYF